MSETMQERFTLETLGRATVDGIEWVAYSDGCYRHVVCADDYDADHDDKYPRREDGDDADAYTNWCGDSMFADDATAARVGRECDLTHLHSATDGVCGRIHCVE